MPQRAVSTTTTNGATRLCKPLSQAPKRDSHIFVPKTRIAWPVYRDAGAIRGDGCRIWGARWTLLRRKAKHRPEGGHIVSHQAQHSLRLADQHEADSKALRTATERQSIRAAGSLRRQVMSPDSPSASQMAGALCHRGMFAANRLTKL